MRKTILFGAMLALVSGAAFPAQGSAQTPQAERDRKVQPRAAPGARALAAPADRIIEQRDALGLTDAQVAQITAIRDELRAKNAPLVAQLGAARERMRAERPQPTPEQLEQIRARRDAIRDSMRSRLDRLTPEQRARVQERMRARRGARAGAMRGRPDGREGRALPEELRPVLAQLRSNTREAAEQLRAVLTEEQQQKLRELRPAAARGGGAMMRRGSRAPAHRAPGTGAGRR